MGNGYGLPPTDETYIRDLIRELKRRLSELEALDGSQIYDSLKQIRDKARFGSIGVGSGITADQARQIAQDEDSKLKLTK